MLSWLNNNAFLKKLVYSFARAFSGALIVTITGALSSPNFTFTRAAGISALVGAVTMGIRAVQALLESPSNS